MTNEEAAAKYTEYLLGHIGNVAEALEKLADLNIEFINDNIDKLREIVKDHDYTKWDDPEWTGYLHHFYPTNDEEAMMSEEFETACRHHIKNNKHHWDYWVDDEGNLISDIDEEEYKLYCVERCCDWLAMANQHEEGPRDWYKANRDFMTMPDYGFALIDSIFTALPEEFELSYGGTRGDSDGNENAEELEEDLYLNRDVVKNLGKRVRKSKTSNTIEIDTSMTNHDKQLHESSGDVYGYRSIGREEFYKLIEGDTIEGAFDNSTEKQNTSEASGVVAFYKEPYKWSDARHNFFIKCRFNLDDVVDSGTGTYFASKDFGKTKKWTGRRGNTEYKLDEFYVSSYNLSNVIAFDYSGLDLFNDEFNSQYTNKLKSLGIEELTESLTEMTAAQIMQKSKNQDPERVNRSRKVKSTYLGMSKFGILNFKTTSQSREGHHYQTVEFKDMKYFEDIIKSGKDIMPNDIKEAIKKQDINIWCTDESFTYWAWGHLAYKYDFLYMDDRIPDLDKRIQAPKVNNKKLNGGSCKHILSVLNYMIKPFVLLAISEDMNKYLAGNKEDKYSKQTDETKAQKDQVAQWNWDDIEKYTGLDKIQIMRDISKTVQIVPSVDPGDVITDLVGEALPQEDQGLKREIVDRIEELTQEENKD